MSEVDNEIVKDFVDESKGLIEKLLDILNHAEGDYSQVQTLAEYGNLVDRIMGGAKSLAMLVPKDHAVHVIGDYAAVCKAVGYKTSQINNNEQFYDICVALLLDATENLDALIDNIDKPISVLKQTLTDTFLERVRWVSNQFTSDFRESVDSKGTQGKLEQSEIDALLKKLGIG